MKQTSLFAAVGLLVLSAMAGCGGNVVVDPPTGGLGGAGGSGGGGGNTTTTTITTTTTSSTIPPPATYCESVCTQANQYGCLDGLEECIQGCASTFEQYPECTSEVYGLYDCALGQIATSGCNAGENCQKEVDAFSQCLGGSTPCGEDGCFGSEDACTCEGQCDGQSLTVECYADAGGVQCVCSANGEPIAKCSGGDLSCSFFDGCCSEYFFGGQEG